MALRILIIGHTYNQTGIGITLANLFAGFPAADVAFAAINPDFSNPAFHACFVLGNQEYRYMPPLNLFLKIPASRIVHPAAAVRKKQKKGFKWKVYHRLLNPLLQRTGLYDDRIRYTLSGTLKDWIAAYDPDVIYSALGNYSACRFFLDIMQAFPLKKYAVHFMDDWIHSQPQHKLFFRKKYEEKLDAIIRQLLGRAGIRITISRKMAEEYERCYGYRFAWFHNPVKVADFYLPAFAGKTEETDLCGKSDSPGKSEISGKTDASGNTDKAEKNEPAEERGKDKAQAQTAFSGKSIVYIGKINQDNIDGLNDCLEALGEVNERVACRLDLYTPTPVDYVNLKIKPSPFLRLHPALPYQDVPSALSRADILFLPLSFRKESIRYTRLSISTKLTEYLATGKPLLVYAPGTIAMTEFVNENRCGFTLTEKNSRLLADRIAGILSGREDAQIRAYTTTALQLVREEFDSEIVTDRFYRLFHD